MAGGLNRNITVRLLADTSKFTAGMAKVSAEAEKTSTTMEASGGKTKLLTAGIAAAGIAATALGVAAVRMAADFDAGMSTVQANTGASADEMSLLRQAAIDAGADTVYSATDAADAINELGKAGMSTSDILSGGLNGALDLAASDGMEVAEAAELMSSAMAQFNLTGADATRIADALAAGAGKAQGSARDLGYALQQSGMVANSFGISMEETVGTLTSFANAGMTGSDAGTSLKSMLIALANPTKKAQNLMDELGISAYPTQCIHIGGGYWRIANSKKANGDWDFRALADGNGIYANAIYTGKLSDAAGHNQWNLDTGELTTRGMTATSITAEGTFACGSKDWYGIELNSIGQLAGYRKGKKVGYIDYSGGMYEVSNPSKVYYGLQLQGGCLRISTPILSVAKTTDTHVTTTHAYNGKHHYISKITSSSDGTITWFQSTTEYINGFCIN